MDKKFSVLINSKIKKFNKIILMPGDKSISFRALIISSQLIGVSYLNGVLEGDDIKCCIQSLKNLGVKILRKGPGKYQIFGNGENSFRPPKKKQLYFGNAGTLGILTGFLATSSNINVKLIGDKSLNKRNMQKFIDPLSKIGCTFYPKNKNNFPLMVQGTDYGLAQHHVLNSGSAQSKACILMAAMNLPGITTIEERKLSRNHSEKILQTIGANLKIKRRGKYNLISIKGQQNLKKFSLDIPGDPSSSAFFVALCLLTKGSSLKIKEINLNYFRTGFIRCLRSMNANIKYKNVKKKFGEFVGDIIIKSSNLKSINFPKKEVIATLDELPILMTIASQIDGISTFNNIGVLRGKESNRIKKMSENLKAFGIKTNASNDSLKIYGNKKIKKNKQIKIKSSLDHRIQMSFCILGLTTGSNVLIKGCETIKTSFPNFFSLLKKIGAKYEIIKN